MRLSILVIARPEPLLANIEPWPVIKIVTVEASKEHHGVVSVLLRQDAKLCLLFFAHHPHISLGARMVI